MLKIVGYVGLLLVFDWLCWVIVGWVSFFRFNTTILSRNQTELIGMQSNEEQNIGENNVIQSDTNDLPVDTITDTNDLPSDTTTDTSNLPSDTTTDTSNLPTDTNDLPVDTTTDTSDLPSDTNDLPVDTITNTNDLPSDTTTDTSNLPTDTTTDTNDLPSDTEGKLLERLSSATSSKGPGKQFGNLRLYGTDVEKFESLALKLDVKPYSLMHMIVLDFINNPQAKSQINEDVIRKDEESRCAERTETLMAAFMPIVTHQKEIKDLNDYYKTELKKTSSELEKVEKTLNGLQESEEYKLLITRLTEIRVCIKFFEELDLLQTKVYPQSFITSYNLLRAKLKGLRQEMDLKHEQQIEDNNKKLKEGFLKIIEHLADCHAKYPFFSSEGLFEQAVQKLNTI